MVFWIVLSIMLIGATCFLWQSHKDIKEFYKREEENRTR